MVYFRAKLGHSDFEWPWSLSFVGKLRICLICQWWFTFFNFIVYCIAAGKRIESEMRMSRRTSSAPMWRNFGFLLGGSCGHLILFKHNQLGYILPSGRHAYTPSSEVDFKVVALMRLFIVIIYLVTVGRLW